MLYLISKRSVRTLAGLTDFKNHKFRHAMEIYKLLRKGAIHKDFCEDFLLSLPTTGKFSVFGVFDGCSTGIDSHFASTLWAKLIKANNGDLIEIQDKNSGIYLDTLIYNSIKSFKAIKEILKLEIDDVLSTIIVMVIDNSIQNGEILVFGDGMVSVNGQNYEVNQNNQPDYLTYHLNEIVSFDDYLRVVSKHGKRFTFEHVNDIVISSDGINSFEKTFFPEHQEAFPDVQSYLFRDDFLLHNPSMLSRKCNILKNQYGVVNQDDIAMIKVRNC